ncbi:unnamed protein product [Fraxinus pennsylvanica]|uniref:Senescence regulator n=1 Tax=Fraxinus pennsylvanica TaxID=56036 RepID=A0AAD2DUE7_9LAMI|nr:unnamed protein product [Fraxinus pennsylvanica]
MGRSRWTDTESTTMANNPPSPPTLRFIGPLRQTKFDRCDQIHNVPNPNLLELEESDVFWFSTSAESYANSKSPSPPLSNHGSPPHPHSQLRRQFSPTKSGLSAALSEDHHRLIRRQSTLNPSTAAKIIPPVVRSDGAQVKFHQSAPVNVPVWPKKINFKNHNNYMGSFDEVDDEELDDEEEMVPPHVMVARSHATFSVFEGVGRTLKGRDLRRVRNAVFQKTGFLD